MSFLYPMEYSIKFTEFSGGIEFPHKFKMDSDTVPTRESILMNGHYFTEYDSTEGMIPIFYGDFVIEPVQN